jgi:hypothetical protein
LLIGLHLLQLGEGAGAYTYQAGAGATLQVWAHPFVPVGQGALLAGVAACALVGVRAEEVLGRLAMVIVFFLGAIGAAAGADLAGGEVVLAGVAGPVLALAVSTMALGSLRDWPSALLAVGFAGLPGSVSAAMGSAACGLVGGLAVLVGQGLGRRT